MKCDKLFCMLAVCAALSFPSAAWAEAFVAPTLSNLVKTMIRFGALDINDDEVIDVYGQIVECGTFRDYYQDEFKWQKVRNIIRESIRSNVEVFPTGIRYETTLRLDRYDFDEKYYPIGGRNANVSANSFRLRTTDKDYCTLKSADRIPENYRFVLDKAVQIRGLPLSEEEGRTLFNRMEKIKNYTHLIFVRFNLSVRFIAPVAMIEETEANLKGPKDKVAMRGILATQSIKGDAITVDTHLDSIEYYEDEARTRLIYVYRP